MFRGFLFTSSAQMINLLATLVTRILMARLMGPAMYGGFGVGLNAITVMSKALAMGSVPATQYYASKKDYSREDFLRTVLVISATLGTTILLVGLLIIPLLLNHYWNNQPVASKVYWYLLPSMTVVVMCTTLSIILIPWNKVKQFTLIQLIRGASIPLLFVAMLPFMIPLQAAVWSQIAVWWILLIYNLWCFGSILWRGKFRWDLTRNIFIYGLKTWTTVILTVGASRLIVLVGAAYVSATQMGHFVVAENVIEAVFLFHSTLGQLLMSRVSEQEENSYKVVQRAMRLSVAIFAVICLLYLAAGKPVMLLFFGSDFENSYGLSLILLLTGISGSLARLLSNFLAGMGKPERNTISLFIQIAALVVGIVVLAPVYKVNGLAMASGFSALIGLLVGTIQSRAIMKCNLRSLFVPYKSDFTFVISRVKALRRSKSS